MAAFIPPLYSKFGKSLDDLFSKKYGNKKELKVKTSSDKGRLVFESAINFNDKTGSYGGSLKVTENLPDLGVAEAEIDTAGKVKGSMEFDKLAKGTLLKIVGTEKPSGNVTLQYRQENFSSSTSVDLLSSSTVVSQSGVVGIDNLSVGGHVDYNLTSQSIVNYNAGAEYTQSDFTATVQTQDSADQLVASLFHKMRSNINVGTRFNYNLASGARQVVLGGDWVVDANTVVKAKISTSGEVQAALEQRLSNPALLFGFSTRFDASAKSTVPQEFGLSFSFGDD